MEYVAYDWSRPGLHWVVFNCVVLGTILYLFRGHIAKAAAEGFASGFRTFGKPLVVAIFIVGYVCMRCKVAEAVGWEHVDAVLWVIGLVTLLLGYAALSRRGDR